VFFGEGFSGERKAFIVHLNLDATIAMRVQCLRARSLKFRVRYQVPVSRTGAEIRALSFDYEALVNVSLVRNCRLDGRFSTVLRHLHLLVQFELISTLFTTLEKLTPDG
jgi:hypothetical protein